MFAGAGVPWHVFSSFAMLFFEFEFDRLEGEGGLTHIPSRSTVFCFQHLVANILANIVCVQTISIQLGEKNPDFLF